eukprot:390166-Amphidinium_carterae.1
MARWKSSIVQRYVADTPLISITERYKHRHDVGQMMVKRSEGYDRLNNVVAHLQDEVERLHTSRPAS